MERLLGGNVKVAVVAGGLAGGPEVTVGLGAAGATVQATEGSGGSGVGHA
jgi:hypothetical protein